MMSLPWGKRKIEMNIGISLALEYKLLHERSFCSIWLIDYICPRWRWWWWWWQWWLRRKSNESRQEDAFSFLSSSHKGGAAHYRRCSHCPSLVKIPLCFYNRPNKTRPWTRNNWSNQSFQSSRHWVLYLDILSPVFPKIKITHNRKCTSSHIHPIQLKLDLAIWNVNVAAQINFDSFQFCPCFSDSEKSCPSYGQCGGERYFGQRLKERFFLWSLS